MTAMKTRPTDHSTYQEWLHSELDGALTTGERSQLRDHLVHCTQCKVETEELIRLEQLQHRPVVAHLRFCRVAIATREPGPFAVV